MRLTLAMVATCLGIVGIATADPAHASIKQHTDIPAQGLGPALTSLAKEFDFQVLYRTEVVGSLHTQGASGAMTAAEALEHVLSGTGLTYRYLDDKTVTILPMASGAPAAAGGAHDAAQSEGQGEASRAQGGDQKKSFWDRFRLAQAALMETAGAENASTQPSVANEPVLEEVVVTSVNRVGKAVDRIPGAINVVIQADVAQNVATTEDLTKILEHQLPSYSPSREGRYTFGETLRGRTPLYLIDGIPQSTPLREASVGSYFVDQSMIERVEVINGPSASEGLGGQGGVINYITKSVKHMGTEVNLDAKVSSQFHDDRMGWRTGLNVSNKNDLFDIFAGIALVQRDIDYDAHGRLMGVDNFDTSEHDLLVKLGKSFGADDSQRIQFMINRFYYADDGDYVQIFGNRPLNLTDSGQRGTPPGTPQNQVMNQESLEYHHDALFGGKLLIQLFKDSQSALNPATIDASKQDPRIAPVGTLLDQSAVVSAKKGVRSIYVLPDFLLQGVEWDIGTDYLRDTTEQTLALTHRIWVPPMTYSSLAPFTQLEYEYGPVTVRGGVRHEHAKLDVDDFTTIAPFNTFVRGGELRFDKSVFNIGGIYRIGWGLSAYLSYSQGFGLSDVGRTLRSFSTPNKSVADVADLTPILTTNREVGLNWRTSRATASAALYRSYSPLGNTQSFDPKTQQVFILRTPTQVIGYELSADWKALDKLTLTGAYSRTIGKTNLAEGYPLDIDMTADRIPPQKIFASVNYGFFPNANATLSSTTYLGRHVNPGVVSLSGSSLQEDFGGYTLVDGSLSYETRRLGNITLAVENLTNRYYIQEISSSSINQVPSGPNAYYLSGRGRMVSLSDSFKW
jgi:iron complex outermembrane recepter protein